jgi:hypothetical protein
MRLRARILAILLPVALAAAVVVRCGLAPDDELILNGQVTDVDGTPLQDSGVFVARTEQEGCPETIHEAVNGQNQSVAFDAFTSTQTDDQGNYAFEVWRFQTWTEESPGDSRCFRLEVDGNGGSRVYLQLSGGEFNSSAPTMLLWQDGPQIAPGPDGGLLAQNPKLLSTPIVATIDGGPGQFTNLQALYDWVLLEAAALQPPPSDGGVPFAPLAWHSQDLGDPLLIDGPLVEDFSLCVGTEALLVPGGFTTGGGNVSVRIAPGFNGLSRSALSCLPKGTTVPVSRGKSCSFDGTTLPGVGGLPCGTGCPLTDGALDVVALRTDRSTPDGGQDEIDIDLGQSTALATIIIRGLLWSGSTVSSPERVGRGPPPPLPLPMNVLGSVDDVSFNELASIEPLPPLNTAPTTAVETAATYAELGGSLADYRVDLPGTPQVRYLRFQSGLNQAFWAVREISAFAP